MYGNRVRRLNVRTVRSKQYRRAFRVDPWDVERLIQSLGGDESITSIVLDLADGSSLSLRHAAELAEISNRGSRSLRRLCVESLPPAYSSGHDSAVRIAIVELRDRGPYGVSFHVSGDESTVRELGAELESWSESVTPWFASLAFANRAALMLGAVVLLGSIAGLGVATALLLSGIEGLRALSPVAGLQGGIRSVAAGGLGMLALAMTILAWRPAAVFPKAQFQFGEGASRWSGPKRRRRVLIGSSGSQVSGIPKLSAATARRCSVLISRSSRPAGNSGRRSRTT